MAENHDEPSNIMDSLPRVKIVHKYKTGLKIKQIVFLESALSYLLFTYHGEVYVILNGQEQPIKLDGRCTSKQFQARYASAKHSLIFQDGEKLIIRRDHNGVFSLQTAFLDNPFEAGQAKIEIPIQEAHDWQLFFRSNVGLEFCNEYRHIMDFENAIKHALEEYYRHEGKLPSVLIKIPKLHEFLVAFESAVVKKFTKNFIYPIFPLAFWFIERMRWILSRESPYHALPHTNTKGRNVDVASVMNSEAARVLSFYRWPHMDYQYALPQRMAETGFFFQPNLKGEDRVVCFSCNICLVMWEFLDEPFQEHVRHHSNHCRFIEDLHSENVPIDVTCATQPYSVVPFDSESKIVSSTVNASSEFYALADARNATLIRMFHLDSAPMQSFSLTFNVLKDFESIYYPETLISNHKEMPKQAQITAISVSGCEKFTRSLDCEDADTGCLIYVGASCETTEGKYWYAVLIYRVTRHLKAKIEPPKPPSPSTASLPASLLPAVSADILSENLPSTSSACPDDDVIDVDFWSADDIMDDIDVPEELKSKPQKKARHEEPNPAAEIDYEPFKLNYSLIGNVKLKFDLEGEWIINNICTCDADNGLVAVSAYLQGQEKAAVAHFPKYQEFHTINPDEVKIHFLDSEVTKLAILPVDHFASFRAVNFDELDPFGPNVIIGNTVILMKNKEIILFDSVSNLSTSIGSHKVDFVIDEKQNLMVANSKGEMEVINVAASLTGMQAEKIDEVALSLISTLNSSGENPLIEELNKTYEEHANIKQIERLLPSLPVCQAFHPYNLQTVHSLIKSLNLKSLMSQTRVMTQKAIIATLENHLQHSLGFQLMASPHWVETVRYLGLKAANDPSTPAGAQPRLKDAPPKNEQPGPTRSWLFQPEKERPLSSYVFKMTMIPGMPVSHLNFKFSFIPTSNGCPDATFTIFYAKDGGKLHQSSSGMEPAHLMPYCENSALLKAECEKLLGPYPLEHFVGDKSLSATIQLSSTILLEALAAANLKEGWFSKPVFLYLHIHTSSNPSLAQQINTRTQLIAQASKARSKGDRAKASRVPGAAKKKFHPRKAFMAKVAKPGSSKTPASASAARLAIVKRQASSRRHCESPIPNFMEFKDGQMCIEEFSVTLYRCKKQSSGHEQLQRMILQKDRTLHRQLLDMALKKDITSLGFDSLSEIFKAQAQALDLLIWISQGWRLLPKSASEAQAWIETILASYKQFFAAAFATAPSKVAQKWCILIGHLLKILATLEAPEVPDIFAQLINNLKNTVVKDLSMLETAGSLHWFLSFVFSTVYESTYVTADGNHVAAANDLSQSCMQILSDMGGVFQKRWSGSIHEMLSTKFGLNELVFDLNMFDFPSQLLVYRCPIESIDNEISRTIPLLKHPHVAQISAFTGYTPAPNAVGYTPFPYPPSLPKMPREPPSKTVKAEGESLISGKTFPYSESGTLNVMELLNIHTSKGDDPLSKPAWLLTVPMDPEWFDIDDKPSDRIRGQSDAAARFGWSRFQIGPEFLPSLMECEPLNFECVAPADYMQVFNTETQVFASPASSEGVNPRMVVTQTPEVRRILASVTEPDVSLNPNYQLSNEIFSAFKAPPDLVLSIDRVTTNSTRYVLLDFGGPTVLKSFIIPPSEYVQSISIDGVWFADENDGIRIAHSTTIGSKALIASSMPDGVLVQKLKLTFVMRNCHGKARVHLGRYFGSKWLTNADIALAAVPCTKATGEPVAVREAASDILTSQKLTKMLQYFCEEVRCRYNGVAAELAKLLEEGYSAFQIRETYASCFNLRHQWNIAFGVMEKLQSTTQCLDLKLETYENLTPKGWNEINLSTLQGYCSYLLNFCNELTNLLDLRDSARVICAQSQMKNGSEESIVSSIGRVPTQLLALEQAVAFFDYYCTSNVPSLKASGCAFLFKHGCFSSWWGDFFPLVLRKHFGKGQGAAGVDNETFVVLSVLCAHSVKHTYLQQVVMEKLFSFVIEVVQELLDQPVGEYSHSSQYPLLSWTFQLLSTSFDVISCNKRKTDRWSFLAGIFGQSCGHSTSSLVSMAAESFQSKLLQASNEKQSIRDKILSRWKESFYLGDFTAELEMPQYISRRLEILRDRLFYLHSLIREEFDGVPAVKPPQRAFFNAQRTATVATSTEPVSKAPTPPLADPSTKLLLVALHNTHRLRQYSARLKIPKSLCLSVIHHLARLLLHEKINQLVPYGSQLLAIKIISKICLHGSSYPISLTTALGEQLDGLVLKLLKESKDCEWMRYALLMLLVDLTDAEIRTIGKGNTPREVRVVADDPEENGIEAKRHKLDTDLDMPSEENSVSNELSDHAMEDLTSVDTTPPILDYMGFDGSKTAAFAGVDDSPWAFAHPSVDFVAFSNFDNINPETLDDYIVRAAAATLIGMKELNPTFLGSYNNKEKTDTARFNVLLHWCYRLTRYFYDRGESITHIFRFFDEAVKNEAEHYAKFRQHDYYYQTFAAAIFENTRLGNLEDAEKLDKSPCALAFIHFCELYMSDENKMAALKLRQKDINVPRDALELRFFQATVEAKYHVRMYGMKHLCNEMQIPDAEIQKAINGHMVRTKYKLPELTSMALDVNGEKMLSADLPSIEIIDELTSTPNKASMDLGALLKQDPASLENALTVFAKVLFISITWIELRDCNKSAQIQPLSEQMLVEFASSNDTPPDFSSIPSVSEPIQPLDTAELKSALENLNSEAQASNPLRASNQAVHLQFNSDLAVASDNICVKPNDFTLSLLADAQFGYQPIFEAFQRQSIRGTLARNCLHNFVPHCPPPLKAMEDVKERGEGVGQSVQSVINVVNKYLCTLSQNTEKDELEYILEMYLEFTGYVYCVTSNTSSTKPPSLDKFDPPPLSSDGLLKLLHFISHTTSVTEHLWQNVLETVTRNIRKSSHSFVLAQLAKEFNLYPFLSKFIRDSLHLYGLGTGFGPTVTELMGLLINKLLTCDDSSEKFLEHYIDTLNEVFAEATPTALGSLSIESLTALIDIVGQGLPGISKKNTCDIQKVSLLLYRVIKMIRVAFPRFENNPKNAHYPPTKPLLVPNLVSQVNVCFTSVSPISTSVTPPSNEIRSIDTIKLPKLSFKISKFSSNENICGNSFRKTKPKSWQPSNGDSYADYDYNECGFETMRAYTNDQQVFEKPSGDKNEMLYVMLIKFIDCCSEFGQIWSLVVQRYPDTITLLLELLNECVSSIEPITEVNIDFWNPQSLADHLLYVLLAISNDAGTEGGIPQKFMQIVLQTIFKQDSSQRILQLSDPLIFALLKVTYSLKRKELFIQLDGHRFIAEQLKRCLLQLSERWQNNSAMASLGNQLINVANDVNGIVPQTFDVRNLPIKHYHGTKLYNFSPTCKINGHTVATSGIANLLADPVPHRRSRHASYAYTFPQGEMWTSLTISLPCQIMLYELQIKCHQYSMNTPSAVQVELSSDTLPARHWVLHKGQLNTTGVISTVIDFSQHRTPVGAIRIHLRRPIGYSATINLSQISVYGTVTSSNIISDGALQKFFSNWLTLFDKFQVVSPPLVQYSPVLPQKLMLLFMQTSVEHPMYPLLRQVINNIDYRTKSNENTFVETILKYVCSGRGRLGNAVSPTVSAELLYLFCTESDNITAQRADERQQILFAGLNNLLSLVDNATVFDDTSFSVILWAAACIIWTNLGSGNLRYKTVAGCLSHCISLRDKLWNIAINDSRDRTLLKSAAAWLLCSLCRADPDSAKAVTAELGNKTDFSEAELLALSKILQSESSAVELINAGVLNRFLQDTINLSTQCSNGTFDTAQLHLFVTYVEFLADLTVIDAICVSLQAGSGPALLEHLLSTLVLSVALKTDKKASSLVARLDQAIVLLCQRCISYSDEHRKTIANVLTKLLENQQTKFCGRIDGTLLQLILRLILEDEVVTIRLQGIIGPNLAADSLASRLSHPVFGCVSTDRIFKVSVFTPLRDLIPLKQLDVSKQKLSLGGFYDEFHPFESFMSQKKPQREPEISEPTELSDGVVCEELGQKSYVARVFCEQISLFNSLNVNMTLKDIYWHTILKGKKDYVLSPDGKLKRSAPSDLWTFGYLTLLAEIRVTARTYGAADESFKVSLPSNELTMLQHFAIAGGFAHLSKHFPLSDHYSAILETFEALNKKQREPRGSSGPTTGGTPIHIPKNPKTILNQVAFATQQLSQQMQNIIGQVTAATNPLQAMIAGTPVSLSVLEPSAIVSYQNSGGDPGNSITTVLPNNFPPSSEGGYHVLGYALNSMMNNPAGPPGAPLFIGGVPSSQLLANLGSKALLSAATSARQAGVVDKEVPAYTIFALTMFLKLDYYAITLVTCNRSQAKRVIRAAMGLSNDEKEMVGVMSNFRPVMPKASTNTCPIIVAHTPERKIGLAGLPGFLASSKSQTDKTKQDIENLTIYPFLILEKVWTLSGPKQGGKALASKIRNEADNHGVFDVILLCASRFSNTPPRFMAPFPPSSDGQAIDQIFQLSDQIDSLRDAQAAATQAAAKPPPSTAAPQGLEFMPTSMNMPGMVGQNQPTQQGQQDYWAKGTGFGTGTTQIQWNLSEHVRRRKLSEEAVTCMINTLAGFLMPYHQEIGNEEDIGLRIASVEYDKAANFHVEPLKHEDQISFHVSIISRIYNSCIIPVIHSYLTNDSVFDISKHVGVYEACIWFVITIASLKPFEATETDLTLLAAPPKCADLLASMLLEDYRGCSILNQMKKMHEMIKAYLLTINKEKSSSEENSATGDPEKKEKREEAEEEENLEVLAALLDKALVVLTKRLEPLLVHEAEDMEVDDALVNIENMTIEDIYMQHMKALQYESISFMKEDSKSMEIAHHYSSQFLSNTSTGNPKRMRRLAQEAITLSNSLPLSLSSSVFLRACEERLDVFKVLITGPADTPYANGCFEFDAYFPTDYPNVPVLINLQTTGGNSVRFNPNLYNDGKVCLSILNTWHGRPEERWNAETSSFLQVIVSIQSLILVKDPYFNEPGYERSRHTAAGQAASHDYDANIRNQTIRWAMLENLKHPPKAFEEVIRRHFWIKRDEICDQINDWIAEMQKSLEAPPTEQSSRAARSYLSAMTKNFELLKDEFAKIKPPAGLDNVVSKYFGPKKQDDTLMEEEPPSQHKTDETVDNP